MTKEQINALLTKHGKENIERIITGSNRSIMPHKGMLEVTFDDEQVITKSMRPGSGDIIIGYTDYDMIESIYFFTNERFDPESNTVITKPVTDDGK